ncbi:MAG: Fe-S cluster assembly protein SufD [Pseudomonadota bacterium]
MMTQASAQASELPDATAWPLDELQQAEFARFRELGFPTTRSESWRYTPTTQLKALTQQLLHDDGLADVDADVKLERLLAIFPILAQVPTNRRLIFRNGVWIREQTALGLTPVARASDALGAADSALAALNGARADTTLHARLGETPAASELHIVHILDGDAPLLAAPRIEFDILADHDVTLVEYLVQVPGSAPVFNNALMALRLKADAKLRFRRLQVLTDNAHSVAEARISLDARSRLDWFSIDTGAALARNDIRLTLDGRDANADLAGVFVGNGKQHIDNRLDVAHAEPGARSRQEYVGLVAELSKAVYHGKVTVAEGADATVAHQHNRNLMLSDTSEIFARPELEIYADEVECAHGSTTGQLDDNALFYLQSRGLSRDDARRLLIEAFVASALTPVADSPLAEPVNAIIADKLAVLGMENKQ